MARRQAGSAPEYGEMGDRLRAARLATGLSLRTLADRLGVSPSLISQVETGRAKPSVSTLYAIVNALGISLDELLFTDAWSASSAVVRPVPGAGSNGARHGAAARRARTVGSRGGPASGPAPGAAAEPNMAARATLPNDPVQRASTRAAIRLASGVIWERLTTASIPDVDFLYVTYEVGGASSPEDAFQRHSGQEWGYVLSGTLGVRIGFDEHLLGPGDAIAFDSSTPHRLFNAGTEPVHGIWFVQGRGAVEIAAQSPDAAAQGSDDPEPPGRPAGRPARSVHSH